MLPKGEHESPELDPEMTDALHRAFDAFGAATGRALREEEGPAIRVRREFSRVAVAPEILAGLALPADGALARIPLAVGGWRMDLWEIVSPPPAPAAAASAPAEGGTTVRRRKAGKGRVLVADDTSSIRTIVKWVLEREGYEVHEAQTGKEAVEKAAVVKPDVVLIDVMMPQMDGFEACRHIRQLPGGGDLAVIITSSKHRPEDVLEGARSGAIDYLVKPFTHATLLDKIRKAREKPRSA
jgi:CheY-like chemotaxis protein